MVAPRGAQEDPFPPLKGTMKTRRLIAEAVDKVPVADVRGDTWFGLFDEVGMVNLLKGLRGSRGAALFGETHSRGTWHPIRVVVQAGKKWKTNPNVAKVEPHWNRSL